VREPRVTVLVHSYNRPRLLREALASVVAGQPDEIIVVDDGSTFDVAAVCAEFGARLHGAPPMTVDERMTQPRQGRLINEACALATGDILCSLCDDDLHYHLWYLFLRAAWVREPERELVRGRWLQFEDGKGPTLNDPECRMDDRQMTAGNFAWHASLTRDRGARWPTNITNCLDNGFLISLTGIGVGSLTVPNVGIAGWRREHPWINGRYSNGAQHTPGFRDLLERGWLEA
jgi:hypothetical protein